jgi:CDP-diacylglycerol---serine O-phosphatidyltransferase
MKLQQPVGSEQLEIHKFWWALPNAVTLLAMCAGLSAVPFAIQGAFSQAIGCILLSAFLDACDGRVARFAGTSSRFGAELDSLSDVICFGAVPALTIYLWGLSHLGFSGWLACLTLCCATALRLARFNVLANEPHKPVWSAAFFQGVPAPAGAFLALLPIYIESADLASMADSQLVAVMWLPLVAGMMVSSIPTFSGKLISRIMLRAMFVLASVGIGFLLIVMWKGIWTGLSTLVLIYLATIPLSLWRHALLLSRAN